MLKKEFTFHNATITMEKIDYGTYLLTGMGNRIVSNDSLIFDNCDNEIKTKNMDARRTAYRLLKRNS